MYKKYIILYCIICIPFINFAPFTAENNKYTIVMIDKDLDDGIRLPTYWNSFIPFIRHHTSTEFDTQQYENETEPSDSENSQIESE